MEFNITIKSIKTPTDTTWNTTLPPGFSDIKGRVYNISKKRDANKGADGKITNPFDDEHGYWSANAEISNLVTPFTNPITNSVVSENKIEVAFDDIHGWGRDIPGDNYFEYLSKSVVEKVENRFKDLFGIQIKFNITKVLEEKSVTNTSTSATASSATASNTSGATASGATASGATASGATASGATASGTASNIDGEFTFNVEEENTFIGVNNQFGKLFIIGIGEIKEEPTDSPDTLEPEVLDEEYQEEEYSPENKEALELASARDEEQQSKAEQENSSMKNDDVIDQSSSSSSSSSSSGNDDIVGTPVKQKTVKEAIMTVMNILIKEGGFTKEQAAGICGNIKAESGFKYWNVENGASNIRPSGTGTNRWNAGKAYGKNYSGSVFSGIGLAQWTYGRRYNMEAYVGKWLTQKGVKAKTLTTLDKGDVIFDTDPGLHKGETNVVYGGAGDNLEAYLKTVDKLFEAQCSFLQHELKNSYSSIVKMFNGGNPSGNTSTLMKNGFFINYKIEDKKKKVAPTVAGYAECVVCNFEVPGPVGKAVNGKAQDSYKNLVAERVKNAMDCLATFNGK